MSNFTLIIITHIDHNTIWIIKCFIELDCIQVFTNIAHVILVGRNIVGYDLLLYPNG